MAFLIVRIKGTVNVPYWANATLKNLHLEKRFTATIVPETNDYLGMLRKVTEWIAWTKIDQETLTLLIIKKGRKQNNSDSKNKTNYDTTPEDMSIDLVNEKLKFFEQKVIKPWFSLNSPRGGFKRKSKKQYADGGVLGNNKELIELVRRMI